MKPRLSFFVPLFFCLLTFFTGCTQIVTSVTPSQTADDSPELWIVSEKSTSDGLNFLINDLITQFQGENPNVTLNLEILPVSEVDRSASLKRIRSAIASGHGPDVFLLQTSTLIISDAPTGGYSYLQVEPLFADPTIAMNQGLFFDISKFYEKDMALQKNALNSKIMDSGVIGASRYILPLKYDVPVFYVLRDRLSNTNLSDDFFQKPIDQLMHYAIDLQDHVLSCGVEYTSLQAFYPLRDPNSNKLLLDAEILTNYMELFQQIECLVGTEVDHRNSFIIQYYLLDSTVNCPIRIGYMSEALDAIYIAAAQESKLDIYPVHSIRNEIVANVKYYGAVGSNSKYAKVAYSFLSMFLSEYAQWEQYRSNLGSHQSPFLPSRGWPVRSIGSVSPLWNAYRESICKNSLIQPDNLHKALLESMNVDDYSLPILLHQIDQVSFGSSHTYAYQKMLYSLNDYNMGGVANEVDISGLALNFLNSWSD